MLLKIYFLYDVRLEIDEFPSICNGNADEYKDLIDINIITQNFTVLTFFYIYIAYIYIGVNKSYFLILEGIFSMQKIFEKGELLS